MWEKGLSSLGHPLVHTNGLVCRYRMNNGLDGIVLSSKLAQFFSTDSPCWEAERRCNVACALVCEYKGLHCEVRTKVLMVSNLKCVKMNKISELELFMCQLFTEEINIFLVKVTVETDEKQTHSSGN